MIDRRTAAGVLAAVLAAAAPAAAAAAGRAVAREAETPAPPAPATAVPAPIPTLDASVAARARAEFDTQRSGKLDRSRYTSQVLARLHPEHAAETAGELQGLGEVKSFTQVRKITGDGMTLYVFRIVCQNPPTVEETIGWDGDGKVAFLSLRSLRQ